MELTEKSLVSEIVRENYITAQVFEKYNVDFCCGGNISLHEVSKKMNLDVDELISVLRPVMDNQDRDSKFIENLPLDYLCNYVEEIHHAYINEKAPFIQQKLTKLCEVHGQNHPELFEVKKLFDLAVSNLTSHMKKEELILFPHIRKLVSAQKGELKKISGIGNILDPISVMKAEHEVEGERFRKMAIITNQYVTPDDGCNTYKVTYEALADFDKDLHRHIHLENNILFPKAIDVEKELM
ncbi:MAG: iron-sulfur cluster repair di-iron protein [Mariniphaga sp.]|nr:iron-sulfur cluster repair di-iron protein [Mariniphaga sp.]MDD4426247.1 iron-sulfur cluster repair di-iron protein [Mariniphaga sp.]